MPAMTHVPEIVQPADDLVLKRFLTGEKFGWLLRDHAIYLRQLAKLMDEFEGATPAKTKVRIEKWITDSNIDPSSVSPTTFPSYHARERHYVTCWFGGAVESDAMWRLYCVDKTIVDKSSVMIETTYAQLVAAFDESFWAGNVCYVDFDEVEDSSINDFNIVFLKRREFEHEREIRVAKRFFHFNKNLDETLTKKLHLFGTQQWLDSLYDQPDGINHPVTLESILNRVVVHPEADSARRIEVERQLNEAGIACAVVKSSMSNPPFRGYHRES
jgi:hypothetical protein